MFAALAALASSQFGVVSAHQLYELGFSPHAVSRMARERKLHRLYRIVYAVGHRSLKPQGRLMAAALACGPGAVLSHRQAAWVHEIRRGWGGRTHVTTPLRGRRGPSNVTLHRVRSLHPEDVTRVDNLPVTSVARTLFDLSTLLPKPQFQRAMNEAERRGLLDAAAVRRVCERGRGCRAVTLTRAALAEAHPHQPMTRSELELAFLEFCRESGIPEPSMNVWLHGQEVDAAWIDDDVVVELDDYAYHGTRQAFEEDRARSAVLTVADVKAIRVTPHRLENERATLRSQLRSLLGLPR